MNWRERLKTIFTFRRISPAGTAAPVASPQTETRMLTPRAVPRTSGRISQDDPQTSIFTGAFDIIEPFSADDFWRDGKLDVQAYKRISIVKLVEVLCDLSPDISRALWDFLRMCNPGYEITVKKPRGKAVYAQGQAAVDDLFRQLKKHYGSADLQINRMFMNLFLRGGSCAELVLDEAGRLPIDLAVPDAGTLSFKKMTDPLRGEVWATGQWQQGQFVRLDELSTFRFTPLDPLPGKHYGRSIVAPAVFATMFLMAMLHDLRRVIMQQGYPRLDLEITLEKLNASIPDAIKKDPKAYKEAVDSAIQEIEKIYASLEPEDAFVHTDVAKINRPVGTVDSSSLGAVDGLIKALERFLVRALKTMPLMMGTTDGVSEANANRQWEIYAAGVKSLQHLVESQLESLLQTALEAQGIQAVVEFRFAELRAAEMLRDAQTEALKIKNAKEKYLAGWINQDAAAKEGAGVDKADVPEPRSSGNASEPMADPLQDVQPEPGANRKAAIIPIR